MFRKYLATFRWVMDHPLNRGSKWKALRTFVRVQLGARMIQGNVCVPFPNGSVLLVPPWMKGAAHYLYPGLAEFEEMSFIMHFLRCDDLFVDVGANLGAFTVIAGAVAGSRVVAFEPAPSTFDFLARNIRLNNLSERASGRNLAVGSREGKVLFTSGLGTENHIIEPGSVEPHVEVGLVTLDSQLSAASPTVMKVDVEGFEDEVAAGATKVLPQLRALLIERAGNAARFGKTEAGLHAHLRNLGFIPCQYEPAQRRVRQIPDDVAGCNIIYIRDLEEATKRLREAPPYQFAGQSI